MAPDKYTNQIFNLPVGDGHKLRITDWGNKDAKTTFIYLHGGPGGHAKDKQKLNFDPALHRVIFFDQRGCGESTPYGSLKNNDTAHLSADIIKIADHLQLAQFSLYGYSWGSTLALYTAIHYPDRIKHLVIGGVYSGADDLSQMLRYLQDFFPETYAKILADTPAEHHKDLIKYYRDQLNSGTPAKRKRAAYIINQIEGTIISYDSDLLLEEPYADFDPIPTIVENHFIENACFLPKDYLIKNAPKITAETYIIQGRSDLVCPPKTAYEINQKIPHSHLYFVNSNHHSEREFYTLSRAILRLL